MRFAIGFPALLCLAAIAARAADAAAPEMPARGICSHRGSNHTHPENTLAAFREAIRAGAHQIEFDIKLTKQGELVILHDTTVDRTTDGTGDVRELTLEAIKALDAGIRKDPRFAGERIPTLDEALDIMPRNVWLNLHVSGGRDAGAAVARKVVAHGRVHQAFLACGRAAADGARAEHAGILICNMTRRGQDVARYIRETIEHGDAFIQLRQADPMPTPEQFRQLKEAGVKINFFSVSKPERLAELFELGIDFPLVDNLLPMLERAGELGIEPLFPEF